MSEMEAGRELDALVAEKVMGSYIDDWDGLALMASSAEFSEHCKENHFFSGNSKGDYCHVIPYYSTLIGAAWQVWERLPDELFGKKVCWMLERHGEETWVAPKFLIDEEDECPTWVWAIGSAPLAICRVALKTVNHV